MLGSANNEISLRAAAVNARNTQLTIQLEGLGARLAGAEQQIQEREAALASARTAMLEKDSGLRQLQGQIAALRQQLVEAQQGEMKQGNCIRQVYTTVPRQSHAVAFLLFMQVAWAAAAANTNHTAQASYHDSFKRSSQLVCPMSDAALPHPLQCTLLSHNSAAACAIDACVP